MRVRKPPNCTIYESFVLLWLTAGWNLQSHFAVSLGSYTVQPIRCCLAKSSRLWVGYWNKVHVVDLDSRTTQVNRTLKQRNRITLNVCDAGLVGYLSHTPPWSFFSPHSKRSQSLSVASSRFASCAPLEAAFGRPVDLTRCSDSLTGLQEGRCRNWISVLWSPKH